MLTPPICAMLCITALVALALANGIDGAIFGVGIAAIAGLGGYQAKIIKDKVKGGK